MVNLSEYFKLFKLVDAMVKNCLIAIWNEVFTIIKKLTKATFTAMIPKWFNLTAVPTRKFDFRIPISFYIPLEL